MYELLIDIKMVEMNSILTTISEPECCVHCNKLSVDFYYCRCVVVKTFEGCEYPTIGSQHLFYICNRCQPTMNKLFSVKRSFFNLS